jgi:hypothetical protein
MGMSSYEMGGVIGTDKVMSEEEAQQIINPNETIELLSSAKKKVRNINKQADESPIFNLDADDDLLDADIGDDMLEVIDKRIPFEDFEDE